MRVKLDPDVCDAHGDCVVAAPEIFDLDDDDDVAKVLMPSRARTSARRPSRPPTPAPCRRSSSKTDGPRRDRGRWPGRSPRTPGPARFRGHRHPRLRRGRTSPTTARRCPSRCCWARWRPTTCSSRSTISSVDFQLGKAAAALDTDSADRHARGRRGDPLRRAGHRHRPPRARLARPAGPDRLPHAARHRRHAGLQGGGAHPRPRGHRRRRLHRLRGRGLAQEARCRARHARRDGRPADAARRPDRRRVRPEVPRGRGCRLQARRQGHRLPGHRRPRLGRRDRG